MAYSSLPSKSDSDTLDLSDYNAIKNNFEAGMPDQVTAKGDLGVGTGADAIARLAVGGSRSMLTPEAGETTGLKWQKQPSARVYTSGAIDPTVATWVALTFDSESWDTDDVHDTGTNTERLTIPADGDGIYQIGGYARFATGDDANEGNVLGLRIMVNGTTDIDGQLVNFYRAEDDNLRLNVSAIYDCDGGEWVELDVYVGRDINVTEAAFWIAWIGPAAS